MARKPPLGWHDNRKPVRRVTGGYLNPPEINIIQPILDESAAKKRLEEYNKEIQAKSEIEIKTLQDKILQYRQGEEEQILAKYALIEKIVNNYIELKKDVLSKMIKLTQSKWRVEMKNGGISFSQRENWQHHEVDKDLTYRLTVKMRDLIYKEVKILLRRIKFKDEYNFGYAFQLEAELDNLLNIVNLCININIVIMSFKLSQKGLGSITVLLEENLINKQI
jgi:hypothetical protein